jgi:hypothetical protein
METEQLKQFRERLYQSLGRRADATMDLLDALSSNTTARSVIELSLSPAFRRRHTSVADAIDALYQAQEDDDEDRLFDYPRRAQWDRWRRAVAPALERPSARPFWLVALDGLALARPQARTLSDRSYVYHADPAHAQAPITVGHAYSLLVALPEKGEGNPPWALSLSARRIPSTRTAADVGAEQTWDVLADEALPWAGQLVVLVVDSLYSQPSFLSDVAGEANLVVVTRLRRNRVLYRTPPPRAPGQRGRPRCYGARFALAEETTWGEPDERCELARTTHTGRPYCVEVRAWHDLLMRGKADFPMQTHPFTLLRLVCRDEAGEALFRGPMWLAVVGARRQEVAPPQAAEAYRQRFDQEHTHRFLRQRLLADAFQTPDTEHEETWISLVLLAHAQLFAARRLAQSLPRPWERRPTPASDVPLSPTLVQRDFARILRQVGTPARAPQPRGKAPGRAAGTSPGRRPRHPVVYKGPSRAPPARIPA